MIKDIEDPKVEHIGLAAVPEEEAGKAKQWYVYLLNFTDIGLDNVIVASRGYGKRDGQKVETSQLRHHIDNLPPRSYAKVEPIMDELFGLTNQYWVSFFIGPRIYDKKYVFLPESIVETHLTEVPLIDRPGVLLR